MREGSEVRVKMFVVVTEMLVVVPKKTMFRRNGSWQKPLNRASSQLRLTNGKR